MSQLPILSQQAKDDLARKGYDSDLVYEINKLPEFAIPRTNACTEIANFRQLNNCISHWSISRRNIYHQANETPTPHILFVLGGYSIL